MILRKKWGYLGTITITTQSYYNHKVMCDFGKKNDIQFITPYHNLRYDSFLNQERLKILIMPF